MESKTTTAIDERPRGQALLSFCLALPALLAGFGAFFWASLMISARTLLDVETYALARAHLYGNSYWDCEPGRLWGLATLSPDTLKVSYRCEGARVRGELEVRAKVGLWDERIVMNSDVDLGEGHFGRRPK